MYRENSKVFGWQGESRSKHFLSSGLVVVALLLQLPTWISSKNRFWFDFHIYFSFIYISRKSFARTQFNTVFSLDWQFFIQSTKYLYTFVRYPHPIKIKQFDVLYKAATSMPDATRKWLQAREVYSNLSANTNSFDRTSLVIPNMW